MVFRINAITAALFSVSAGLAIIPHPVQAADNSAKVPPALRAGAFDERCYSDVPPATPTEYSRTTPVEVSADKLNATRNGKAVYQGGVEVSQGNKYFSSDYTELDQVSRDVLAHGNIFYRDGQVTLKSNDQLTTNLDTKESRLDNAKYQLHGSPARGEAKKIVLDNQKKELTLSKARFTTCPVGQESWWLSASEVNVNQKEVFGEAWNATLWLKDIPIFYTPYITFPIKDERKSGLLYPTFTNSSSNGFDISTPYYWNIAPNYDLTFTPRVMSARGTMEQVEYRYMPEIGHSGTVYTEYMSNDRKTGDSELNPRWLMNVRHNSKFEQGDLRWTLDYTRVDANDYNYFNELHPPVGQIVDNQLLQSTTAGYYQKDWNFTTEVRDYQILLPNTPAPHQLLPQLTFNQYHTADQYSFSFNSEASNFGNRSEQYKAYTGQRLHAEPAISVPILQAPGYSLDAESKLMATYYQQNIPDDMSSYYSSTLGLNHLASNVTRTLPEARVHGTMSFERQTAFNDQSFTQTLEPEVQYLYIPYKNQDNIGLYDTTNMQSDYYNLFSDRRFAGLDRISDANRISYGATTRLFDYDNTERVRFTIGQAYDLVAPKVTLLPNDQKQTNSRSLLSVRADTHPTDDWYTHAGTEYNTQTRKVSSGNGAVEYQQQKYTTQVNYRFVSKENFVVDTADDRRDVSQFGTVLKVPLNRDWQLIGAHYRDTQTGKSVDNLLGARYDSCCWAVNFTFERNNTPDNTTLTAKPETSYGLQFEFKGLGSVGNGPKYNLNTRLLPYSRPFNLND
jgi:Organic solvent tolerance protein OstA